jgi:hypothetical protein
MNPSINFLRRLVIEGLEPGGIYIYKLGLNLNTRILKLEIKLSVYQVEKLGVPLSSCSILEILTIEKQGGVSSYQRKKAIT